MTSLLVMESAMREIQACWQTMVLLAQLGFQSDLGLSMLFEARLICTHVSHVGQTSQSRQSRQRSGNNYRQLLQTANTAELPVGCLCRCHSAVEVKYLGELVHVRAVSHIHNEYHQGPSIYDVHTKGGQAQVDACGRGQGGKPHVDVHTEK